MEDDLILSDLTECLEAARKHVAAAADDRMQLLQTLAGLETRLQALTGANDELECALAAAKDRIERLESDRETVVARIDLVMNSIHTLLNGKA